MNILVLTEGGYDIGLGHLTRCLGLAQGVKEYIDRDAEVHFLIKGDGLIESMLKGQRFKVKLKDWIKEDGDLESNLKKADLAIVDSYLAPKLLYDKIYDILSTRYQTRRLIPTPLVIIDDNSRLNYPPAVIVNPSLYGDRLNYNVSSESKALFLLGRNYIILRKGFWRVPPKKIKERIADILITFGGKEQADFTKRLLRFLSTEFPSFMFHVVISSPELNPHKSILNPSTRQYLNLSALDMRNLMLESDLCISGGGQTLYELARVGLPTIGICFADNQARNLREFRKEGFLEYAGWHNSRNIFNRVDKAIKTLIPQRVRQKRYEIGRGLIDGEGPRRLMANFAKIKGAEGRPRNIILRPATMKYCRDLWTWRNHPEVRKWSFTTEEIEYARHKEWFKEKIRDKMARIYIAEDDREKVSQVRFEIDEDNSAFININLNPRFFGRGYGADVIKRSTEVFMKENPIVKEVVAEVIDGNIASEKAFQKAGYIFSHNAFKAGKKMGIFKFAKTQELNDEL